VETEDKREKRGEKKKEKKDCHMRLTPTRTTPSR